MNNWMNKCSDVLRCPASFYHNCPAYKEEKNCWEVDGVLPCCRINDKERCKECEIYIKAVELGIINLT